MPIEIKLKGLFLYPGPVSWEVLTEPLYGKLTGAAPDLVYTPDEDFHGDDSFTFMVNDGLADSDPATITINVLSVNDAPVAVADTYETDEDTLLDVTAPGVLENDTDADGDSLTAVLVTGVSNGSLTLNADGSFSYTPNAEFIGTDSFTYKANDGEVDSTLPTTVTITVQEDGMLYYYLPLIVH
jgi:VCBS repeat-containing protein